MSAATAKTGARLVASALALVAASAASLPARAGGMEYPDNGAQALGRGAAFAAKADDGTAIIHNVAGFAQQRGWRLTLGANTALHSASFQREGSYPDNASDPLTPWGGQRFPEVRNTGKPLPIPHMTLSTDLGFERLGLAFGVYAPSVLTGRVFPLAVNGQPSPARYDAIRAGGLILYPTLAAAYRITDWLDVGLAGSYMIARLQATSMSSADLAPAICPNQEYQPCDARQTIDTKGGAAAFSAGFLLRPARFLAIGGQLRTAHTLQAEGTVEAQSPGVQPGVIPPGKAYLIQQFPWVARGGVRYIGFRGSREIWDAEVDVTYEAWGQALSEGTKVYIPKLSTFENIRSTIRLGFRDTVSVRGGGSYAFDALGGELTLRGGMFHDTAATTDDDTRLTFDTSAKTGVTLGAGLRVGPARLDLAVAKIFHETREVKNGSVRPINGTQGGAPTSSSGEAYAPVNNGVYAASTIVLALGLGVEIDTLLGGKRAQRPAAPEEPIRPPPKKRPSDDEDDEDDEDAKAAAAKKPARARRSARR